MPKNNKQLSIDQTDIDEENIYNEILLPINLQNFTKPYFGNLNINTSTSISSSHTGNYSRKVLNKISKENNFVKKVYFVNY